MTIILQLPEVKRSSPRPQACPHCQSTLLQGWGRQHKVIKDTQVRSVTVRRYKCTQCQRTFRHYPAGVTHAQQSVRLMKLCVVMWSLGLSHRSVVLILTAFGLQLSFMSSWRDLREAGQRLQRKLQSRAVPVVGVDGAWMNGQGVMVAVDLGEGRLLNLARLDEKDSAAVQAWLRMLKEEHGIEALVSDDLALYKELADQLDLEHQVCQFHVRRWVGKKLKQLENDIPPEWQYVIWGIRQLIKDLPPNGDQVLFDLWKKMPGRTTAPDQERTPLEKLRDLVLRLSRDWQRYLTFIQRSGIPWTNNRTEQMIGKIKNRAKRVRGFKSEQGLLSGSLAAAQQWQ